MLTLLRTIIVPCEGQQRLIRGGAVPGAGAAGLGQDMKLSLEFCEHWLPGEHEEEKANYSMDNGKEKEANHVLALAFAVELELLEHSISVHAQWWERVYWNLESEERARVMEFINNKRLVGVLQERQVCYPPAGRWQVPSVHEEAPDKAQNQNGKASYVVGHSIGGGGRPDSHAH